MDLKAATAVALVTTALLTILLFAVFVRDLASYLRGLVPALQIVGALIYLAAGFGLTLFLYAFHRSQSR